MLRIAIQKISLKVSSEKGISLKTDCHSSTLKTFLGQNFICSVRVLMLRAPPICVTHFVSLSKIWVRKRNDYFSFWSEQVIFGHFLMHKTWTKHKREFRVQSSTWLDLSCVFPLQKPHSIFLLFRFPLFFSIELNRMENDQNIQNNLKRFIILMSVFYIFGTDLIQLCNRTQI